MGRTVVWISGASSGIGAALAQTCPWPKARIINLDICQAAGIETILFDLTDPQSWATIDQHFASVLADGDVSRVLFLHCAYAPIGKGLIDRVAPTEYNNSLIANGGGILAIAASFLRHVGREQDGGLMVMSSGAAGSRLPGYSVYGSSKAAVEHWVRIARSEVRRRGWGPWIVALRPGLVRTDTAAAAACLDAARFPLGKAMARNLERDGLSAERAAALIWSRLPPPDTGALIDLDPRDV